MSVVSDGDEVKNPIIKLNFAAEFVKKEQLRCFFCGGVHCKRCSTIAHKKQHHESAIENLHSTWITEDILAMQRPSNELLTEYKVLESFKKQRISAVFNLTEPGEHPFCGCGIQKSGFPYDPEILMKAGSK